MAEFSERFVELRGPLTQRDAFLALGVTEQTVRRWENGSRKPDFDSLIAIAKATGLSLDYICGLTDLAGSRPQWWPNEEESAPREGDADALERLGDRHAAKANSRAGGQRSQGTSRRLPKRDGGRPS